MLLLNLPANRLTHSNLLTNPLATHSTLPTTLLTLNLLTTVQVGITMSATDTGIAHKASEL